MVCLCCGKSMLNPSKYEVETKWHCKCIKKFFGTSELPEIDISKEQLTMLAKATVSKGYTVQGVQKKMSLHLSRADICRLTIVNYPNGYILKPQTEEYKNLPEYEHMTMLMASSVGIRTVPHALIRVDDELAYITRRVDRKDDEYATEKYAMEDFCQLCGRLTEDKYRGSYEQCGKVIKQYSKSPNMDMAEFFIRIIFCFATGNSDMHLKNFSLRELNCGKRDFALAEAYDLLPVNIVNPKDKDEVALALNDKNRNLRRNDFLLLADNLGISRAAAEKMILSVIKKKEQLIDICNNSFLEDSQKEQMIELLESRIERLQKL